LEWSRSSDRKYFLSLLRMWNVVIRCVFCEKSEMAILLFPR
jgi:hypothetical protein